VEQSVIGSGWTASFDGNVGIAGTVGQTIIGPIGSAPILGQGFWYALPKPTVGEVRERFEAGSTDAVALHQNAPNPFSDRTTIRIDLPERREISLKLYDGLGRQRAVLAEGMRDAGIVVVELTAEDLESGRYTLQLTSGSLRRTITMNVVK
jgi:hypothetical protein